MERDGKTDLRKKFQTMVASYNRTAPLAYAHKYWNVAWPDNLIVGDFAVNAADGLLFLGRAC